MTALGIDKGDANLKIPDAGLLFKGGDPWSLRAEAPLATLTRDRDYTFKDLHLSYASNGAVDFGGKLNFSLGLKGPVPLGSIDAAVTIDASINGFIEDKKFNAEISAQGCFSRHLQGRRHGAGADPERLPAGRRAWCPARASRCAAS